MPYFPHCVQLFFRPPRQFWHFQHRSFCRLLCTCTIPLATLTSSWDQIALPSAEWNICTSSDLHFRWSSNISTLPVLSYYRGLDGSAGAFCFGHFADVFHVSLQALAGIFLPALFLFFRVVVKHAFLAKHLAWLTRTIRDVLQLSSHKQVERMLHLRYRRSLHSAEQSHSPDEVVRLENAVVYRVLFLHVLQDTDHCFHNQLYFVGLKTVKPEAIDIGDFKIFTTATSDAPPQ